MDNLAPIHSCVMAYSNKLVGVDSSAVELISDSGAVVTLEDGWTYTEASAIGVLSPVEGQAGTRVTIAGTNLLGSVGGTKPI